MKFKNSLPLILSFLLYVLLLIIPFKVVFAEDSENHKISKYHYKNVSPTQTDGVESIIPMANLEGEPSAFINGHVNIITGDFNDFQVDLIVPGIETLSVERSFSGSTITEGSLAAGWNLNLHGTLNTKIKKRKMEIILKFL